MHKAKERLAKMERRHLVAACIVVVVLATAIVAITIALVARTQNQTPAITSNFSVSGEMICLPHKNTNGPQTLECAYGLRGDDDRNYALELGTQASGMQIGQRVHVKGTLTSASDGKYDIVGTIKSVTVTTP